ncbi:histidine kinase [Agromyces mediolanus]|uniref:sensor histidine kinase n=1 Tax=Agromyces mediolanus TaxID=41986 RepID=UPI0038344561
MHPDPAPAAHPAAAPGRGWRRAALAGHLVLAPASVVVIVLIGFAGGGAWLVWATSAVVVALHLSVVLAARFPDAGFGLASAGMLVLVLLPMPGWSPSLVPSAACFLLVLWRQAELGGRTRRIVALAVGLAGVALAELVAIWRSAEADPAWMRTAEGLLLAGAVAGVWVAAIAATRRRERAASAQAASIDEARRAERAGIRGDLHDVIAHSLTVMIARAEAAALATPDPGAETELLEIAESGRDALDGLRAMLSVLDADPAAAPELPLSIDALPTMVAAASTSLHTVELVEEGERGALSLRAELALVRLVQEAITNALRHVEPPLAVRVQLRWTADRVRVVVQDDGGSGPRRARGSGSGLSGVRERVLAADGVFEVTEEGGWRLEAMLPVRGRR